MCSYLAGTGTWPDVKAIQYRQIGGRPELVDVDKPEPGPSELRLQVLGAGLCHSDEFIMSLDADEYGDLPLPLTLGHEGTGVVDALGPGTAGVEVGDTVAVYGPWGCGRCLKCAQGKENYCLNAAAQRIRPPGLGAPGAMAEYMIVDDARHLIPVGDLDPVQAAPLTDAGLTPYHAIKNALPKLAAGSTAVVIGSGGLGHVGIQLLKVLTGARVIALDITDDKLQFARSVGADEAFLSNDDAVSAVIDSTAGRGAEAVFDFVGAAPTTSLASRLVATEGAITLVGIGGGSVPVGYGQLPNDAAVQTPYWGSRSELIEVFELAHRGQISVNVEQFNIADGETAYQRLHDGTLRGRAVITW